MNHDFASHYNDKKEHFFFLMTWAAMETLTNLLLCASAELVTAWHGTLIAAIKKTLIKTEEPS